MTYDRLRILAITSAPRRVRRLLGRLEPPGLPKAEAMAVVVDELAGGLRRLRRDRFDAVFVDGSVIAKVPAAVQRLQRAAPHVPVVTLLTDDREGTAVEALKGSTLGAFRVEAPALRAMLRCLSHCKKAASELEDSRKRRQALASELSLAEERERCRIASELHARTVQSLGFCKIRLGSLREALPGAAERNLAEEMGALLDATIGDLRGLVFELSPPVLYELGFEPAVEWLAERFQRRHGIQCIVEDDRKPKPLTQELSVVLFQAVRELLANVAKHSQAKNVRVSLFRTGQRMEVAVEDDGVGFDAKSIKDPMETVKGFGLFHIRERMRLLGGEVQIASAPGKGARIRLQLPLTADKVR